MKYLRTLGYGLLELLLVLVVIAVLLIIAVKQYQKYIENSHIATLENSVQTGLTAIKQFYNSTCNDIVIAYYGGKQDTYSGPVSNITSKIVGSEFLSNPDVQLVNPFYTSGVNSAVSFNFIIDTEQVPFTLMVQVFFSPTITANHFNSLLGALKPQVFDLNTKTMTWKISTYDASTYTQTSLQNTEAYLQMYNKEELISKQDYDSLKKAGKTVKISCSAVEYIIKKNPLGK